MKKIKLIVLSLVVVLTLQASMMVFADEIPQNAPDGTGWINVK